MDFTAEVERSMRVLDGAVAVFCGVAGVQPQSETVWRQATKYKVPRIAFVNKMDRIGANFENALNDMRKKLNAYAYPIYPAHRGGGAFEGVIDVVNQQAITWGTGEVVREGLSYVIGDIPGGLASQGQGRPLRIGSCRLGQGRRNRRIGHRRQAGGTAGSQGGHPPPDLQE